MSKKFILILFSIIMIIAYADLVDCFKRLEITMSQMIKLDSDIKTKIDSNVVKTQK